MMPTSALFQSVAQRESRPVGVHQQAVRHDRGTPEVAPASCQTTAVTVNGAPVTTAPAFVWAYPHQSSAPSNHSAPRLRPATQLLAAIAWRLPGQLDETWFAGWNRRRRRTSSGGQIVCSPAVGAGIERIGHFPAIRQTVGIRVRQHRIGAFGPSFPSGRSARRRRIRGLRIRVQSPFLQVGQPVAVRIAGRVVGQRIEFVQDFPPVRQTVVVRVGSSGLVLASSDFRAII
jgi:hypothetical protein